MIPILEVRYGARISLRVVTKRTGASSFVQYIIQILFEFAYSAFKYSEERSGAFFARQFLYNVSTNFSTFCLFVF